MNLAVIKNMVPSRLRDIPVAGFGELRRLVLNACASDCRPAAWFIADIDGQAYLAAVLADDERSRLLAALCPVKRKSSCESLTKDDPRFHIFERELFEEDALEPTGHPWLKPVRFPSKNRGKEGCEDYRFFHIEGSCVHEVAVGPVHAGIIEPGHFRFSCTGELVRHLEIRLGYQHRGIESQILKTLQSGQARGCPWIAETAAGDSAIAHASAHAGLVEALCGKLAPRRALMIRAILQEMERAAVHIGDLGALCNDVAYLLGSSVFGALRTLVINSTQSVCGNRFGKGLVLCGGTGYDISPETAKNICETLGKVAADVELMAQTMFDSPTVMARFEGTGIVTEPAARSIGLVGLAARASGISRDVRTDHPYGAYRFCPAHKSVLHSGDVLARAYLRYIETMQSLRYIVEALRSLDDTPGPVMNNASACAFEPSSLCVAMTEGWRGETMHAALTDSSGRITRYKIKDPSFTNWMGLALAVRDNEISDFPLCNKSFNLSYCGNDL